MASGGRLSAAPSVAPALEVPAEAGRVGVDLVGSAPTAAAFARLKLKAGATPPEEVFTSGAAFRVAALIPSGTLLRTSWGCGAAAGLASCESSGWGGRIVVAVGLASIGVGRLWIGAEAAAESAAAFAARSVPAPLGGAWASWLHVGSDGGAESL